MANFIGRYEVAGRIAVGDGQELLLGREPSGKPVAIKRIPPGIGRGSTARHPNLIEIIERVTIGDAFYLVTEYLEGETLAGLVRRLIKRRERIAYGLAAHMIAEVCDGLHAGHMVAELHYAVSPETVFITYGGDVKLLDLGMATIDPESPYRSPEQIANGPLGRQSDLYSVGLVLYELTTLRRVATTPQERDLPVPPPSTQVPDYPRELESVVLRAVDRDAGKRFRSAIEMRDALLEVSRVLGVDEDPQQSLASKLVRLFGERVATKRDLLDRLRVGMPLGDVVPADVDEDVEVPAVFRAPARLESDPTEKSPAVSMDDDDDPHTELAHSAYAESPTERPVNRPRSKSPQPATARPKSTSAQPAPAARPKTRNVQPAPAAASGFRWGVLLLFLIAVGGGGAAGWYLRLHGLAGAAPPVAVDARTPDAAPAIDARLLPAFVTIAIDSEPPGAKVIVDGEDRGATPVDLRVAGAAKALAIELRRDGYQPKSLAVVPDHDQQLHEKLAR